MTARVRLPQPLRRTALAAGRVGFGFVAGVLACTLAGLAFGYRPFTVMSGSMSPAIGTGDVVVVQRIGASAAAAGDIITFPDPSGRDRLITHRVRRTRREADSLHFETKGDANNAAEQWSVAATGDIGRVRHRLPKLGYALVFASGPYGKILLAVIPVLLLAGFELARLWRPRPRGVSGAAAA